MQAHKLKPPKSSSCPLHHLLLSDPYRQRVLCVTIAVASVWLLQQRWHLLQQRFFPTFSVGMTRELAILACILSRAQRPILSRPMRACLCDLAERLFASPESELARNHGVPTESVRVRVALASQPRTVQPLAVARFVWARVLHRHLVRNR